MKYSAAAILLVLSGCASSGPPAVFDLDARTVHNQIEAQRAASAATKVPVPYKPSVSSPTEPKDPAGLVPARAAVLPAPATLPARIESPGQAATPKSNVVEQARKNAVTPEAPASSPIAVAGLKAMSATEVRPEERVTLATPPAMVSVAVAPRPAHEAGPVAAAAPLRTKQQAEQVTISAPLPTPVPMAPIQAQPSGAAGTAVASASATALDSGSNGLRSVLAAWSAKEKWNVVWAPGVEDIQLASGQRIEGSLALAVQTVSKLIPADSKLQITMYEGDKVIHVHPR